MANYDFEHMRIETNVPPGVGAEVTIEHMDKWDRQRLGFNVLQFVKEVRRDPAARALVQAKMQELKDSGWYDAHPPKGGTL